MASPEERLLTFARETYEDHRQREGRLQQVALGLLAFNGAFTVFLGAALWQLSGAAGVPVRGSGWLLVAG